MANLSLYFLSKKGLADDSSSLEDIDGYAAASSSTTNATSKAAAWERSKSRLRLRMSTCFLMLAVPGNAYVWHCYKVKK